MVSYTPSCARRRKLRTCSGAFSPKNSSVIGPALVSEHGAIGRQFRGRRRSANGSGSGGGVSRIVTEMISTREVGLPSGVASDSEILITTSSPSETLPKIVYLPSSAGWSVTQTKNCDPALSGFPG